MFILYFINFLLHFRSLIIRIDHNKDGKLDKVELVAWLEKVEDSTYQSEADEVFSKEDRDGDGFITFEEYWLGMQGGRSIICTAES